MKSAVQARTNIPDLLRMVPGVDVAQLQGDRWAISVRGFNDVYSNKVLVLIDGRTVYNTITSGVFWDAMDVPLNDIERIEVIRGPGGTIWGANAVNGVINIITKTAKETQGLTLTAGAGSEEITDDEARYGGKIGKKGYYRVFGRYFAYGGLRNAQNEEAADGWLMRHGGFRTDWDLSNKDSLMIEGDIYQTNQGEPLQTLVVGQNFASRMLNDQHHGGGGDVLGRWEHTFSSHSQTSLQFYEMNFYHTDDGGPQRINTIDLDFHHHVEVGSRQDIVWGLGYRYTTDRVSPALQYMLTPASKNYSLYSLFFQDEIRVSDAVRFTMGSRFEHNAFTGFEVEPSARLAWAINDRQTLWFAASKAIRQPSRNDLGFDVDLYTFPLPKNQLGVGSLLGNPHFQDEQLRDYEVGYRVMAGTNVSFDFATFYSFYHNLVTTEPHVPIFEASPPPPHLDFPMFWENGMNGQDYGAEASLSWNVLSRWRLSGGYSWLKMNLHPKPTSHDPTATALEHESPQHQFNIRSYLNIRRNLFLDNSLYYVSGLPGLKVPPYTRLDSRLAWHPGESLELSLVGQNLLRSRHFEFGNIDQFIATRP